VIEIARIFWPMLRPLILPWLVRELSKLLTEAEMDPSFKTAVENASRLIRPQMTAQEAKDAARAWHTLLSARRS
jgi:hypothetical protein